MKGEPGRLRAALRLNESLATAYYLKEDLRQIWEQLGKFPAKLKLLDWYHQAMDSGIRVLQDFARTLLAHADGILAWYDYPISTGPLEGTNAIDLRGTTSRLPRHEAIHHSLTPTAQNSSFR